MGAVRLCRGRCIRQAWGEGIASDERKLRGGQGFGGPGPQALGLRFCCWRIFAAGFCCLILLLENLRREKNLICFMIGEGGMGHPHLPAQLPPPHPSPPPAFSSRGHLPVPLKLGS